MVNRNHLNRRFELIGGMLFAFAAGSVDSISLKEFSHFASHMSGTTSTTIAAIMAGDSFWRLGMSVIVAFVTGSLVSSYILNTVRNHAFRKAMKIIVGLEILTISLAAAMGRHSLIALPLLAFAMGAQNNASKRGYEHGTRTTHVTGTLTDIGSALGSRLANAAGGAGEAAFPPKSALKPCVVLFGFVAGGIAGWLAFTKVESISLGLPILSLLMVLTAFALQGDCSAFKDLESGRDAY